MSKIVEKTKVSMKINPNPLIEEKDGIRIIKTRKKHFEKKKVQCCNCENFGHYPNECWFGKGNKPPNNEE